MNCCHLHVTGEGQEIVGLEETAYLETYCDVFEYRIKELYQFPTEEGPLVLEKSGGADCPFWEAWDLSQKVIESGEPKADV